MERSRARGAQQPLPARAAALSLLQLIPTPSVLHAGSGTTPVRLLPDTLGPTRLRAALAVPLAVRSLWPARSLWRALSDEQAEPDDGLMGGEAKDARATLVALAAAFALSHHDIRRACVWWLNPPAATP